MNISYILASIGVFLAVILVLVIVLLVAKKYLSPSGKVTITVNGSNVIEVEQGDTVMNSLNDNGIHLPSACGGNGTRRHLQRCGFWTRFFHGRCYR